MNRLLFALFSALVYATSPVPSHALQWQHTTIGPFGLQPSLAISPGGAVSVASYGWRTLQYCHRTGSGWSTETIGSAAQLVYLRCALALDSQGRPCIAYATGSYLNASLSFARWDGQAWVTQVVDSPGNAGYCASMVLDSDGVPHISYADTGNRSMKHAWLDGATWRTEVISSGQYYQYESSIALDTNNMPCVSYSNWSTGELMYARKTGAGWINQIVDASPHSGILNSLRFDPAGNPCIGYFTYAGNKVIYATYQGSTWTKEVVDTLNNNTTGMSFTLDSRGVPHFAYLDYLTGRIVYATKTSGAWVHEVLTGGGPSGEYAPDIQVDSLDLPHIVYDRPGSSAAWSMVHAAVVPEPTSLLAVVCGLGGLGAVACRARRSRR